MNPVVVIVIILCPNDRVSVGRGVAGPAVLMGD